MEISLRGDFIKTILKYLSILPQPSNPSQISHRASAGPVIQMLSEPKGIDCKSTTMQRMEHFLSMGGV
jgi:hypothetical protein